MHGKKLLLIGYGDIAQRCAVAFVEKGATVTAIARTPRDLKNGTFWQGAVAENTVLQKLAENSFDIAIITLSPGERTDEAYRQTYVENSRRLVDLWRAHNNPPGLIIFVSSTSVYAQNNGEWVDENSVANAESFAGRRLLEAEQLWRGSGIKTCVVRFSGIYGPGRNHLINRVKSGWAGGEHYTNRIHADDCAGVLVHLCQQHTADVSLPDVLLASDCEPVPGWQVSQWLARRMNLTPSDNTAIINRAGNKRCSNKQLLATGYVFKYPSYREGYGDVLKMDTDPSGD